MGHLVWVYVTGAIYMFTHIVLYLKQKSIRLRFYTSPSGQSAKLWPVRCIPVMILTSLCLVEITASQPSSRASFCWLTNGTWWNIPQFTPQNSKNASTFVQPYGKVESTCNMMMMIYRWATLALTCTGICSSFYFYQYYSLI